MLALSTATVVTVELLDILFWPVFGALVPVPASVPGDSLGSRPMETGRTRNLRHPLPAAGTRFRPSSSTRWSGGAVAERRRQRLGGGSKVETETDNKVLVAGEIDDAGNSIGPSSSVLSTT